MNERIKEIVKQATEEVMRNTPSFLVTNEMWQEKFAELIVRECSYLADQAHKKATGGKSAGGYIREHFGVEE